ncbi:serine/threonine-protein kinase, partial [Cellulomonas endophytica]|uniref:serine/threonine-protein kinase n=1 Tax=Cellulomonas endophytica TaxID=2494735 RepID=UPI0013E92DF9
MRAAEGTVLGGRYRLDRPIATGGMGEVWAGTDLSLERPVAVKVLREEFAGDPTFLARFQAEARNSADLRHAAIAQMFDYGEQEGSAYLVQELVDGEPLSEVLEREPVLPPERLVPILVQSARGLDAAHRAGVVHRDVKPGNILVTGDGTVKITDFGVSRAAGQQTMTATGMVMGTAQYLSPEQAVGRPATPLSDLYALGVVAYEALAGRRPFTGPTTVDIAVAHVNSPVPPLPPAVPVALAALVLRLLAKDPAARPGSGAELAALLEAAGRSLTTTRTPVWPRTGAGGALPPSYPPRTPATSPPAGAPGAGAPGAGTTGAGTAPPPGRSTEARA